jgi:hypothetical protein
MIEIHIQSIIEKSIPVFIIEISFEIIGHKLLFY